MKITYHEVYPASYGSNAGKSTVGKESIGTATGRVTTLHILAECGGVFRLVQGFTDKASRDERAAAVFADIIKANAGGEPLPAAKVAPTYDPEWGTEIEAKAAKAVEIG